MFKTPESQEDSWALVGEEFARVAEEAFMKELGRLGVKPNNS